MHTHRVIFIHGISSMVIDYDYSRHMADMLISNLASIGIIKPNSSPEEIKEIITFENVNYSSIGDPEEKVVLGAYKQDSQRLYNVIDKTLESLAFGAIRELVITSISDVLVYESEYWRNEIRNIVLDAINKYVSSGDPVTVIGHSLGSVVGFDTIYYNSRHNSEWKDNNFKPQNFFTFGSPIALFSLELDKSSGLQKPRYIPQDMMLPGLDPKNTNPDLDIINSDGVWYNFLDAQDIIGYPLENLFKDKFKVKDILVQTGTLPVAGHTNYWDNEEIAKTIAMQLAKNIL